MNQLRSFVYYNGSKSIGANGLSFQGEKKAMYIIRGMSAEELNEKIRRKLKLHENQVITSVTGRVPLGNRKYGGFEISDDEDVDVFVQTFDENPTSKFVELYVDIETSEEGIPIPIDELHLSNQSPGTVQPTQSTVVHGEENDYMVDEPDNEEEQEEEDEDTLLANDEDQNDSDADDEHHGNVMSQQSADITPFWNEIPHYEAVDEDYPYEDILDVEGLGRGPWARGDELYQKQEFGSKKDVQAAIKHYCMKEHHEAIVVKSNPTLLSLKCRNHEQGCDWKVRSIKPKNSNAWVVTKWVGNHSCVSKILSQDHRQLDSEIISDAIKDMVKETPSVPVIMIQERVTGTFGYHVSYRKAWKAKQKAIAKIYGDWDESYAFLPRWFEYMLTFSPGSVYNIQHGPYIVDRRVVNGIRVFQRTFWTFSQCCEAFKWCKPVIQVDGTHLYGKYKGTLLIATAQDGNNEILPIAFAIVESETKEAWEYFCLPYDCMLQIRLVFALFLIVTEV